MGTLTAWKAAVVTMAFVGWPLVATAQVSQQGSTQQQPPPQGTSTQPPQTNPPQPGNQGFGQGQGQADNTRQVALGYLTAARQDLADITKLPAAAHIQGQPRSDLNELISNFNALITATGPEWRQAYDRVQASLNALVGPGPEQAGQSAVGTSGAAPPPLDPAIAEKLNDLRQQVNQFGQTVGVKPGESAAAMAQNPGQPSGTPANAANDQALRNMDQIGAIVARALSQAPPDQATISVNRQDLQQIQSYLNQLRQSLGQAPIR
jgi:hypothetical protein